MTPSRCDRCERAFDAGELVISYTIDGATGPGRTEYLHRESCVPPAAPPASRLAGHLLAALTGDAPVVPAPHRA